MDSTTTGLSDLYDPCADHTFQQFAIVFFLPRVMC